MPIPPKKVQVEKEKEKDDAKKARQQKRHEHCKAEGHVHSTLGTTSHYHH